MQFVGGHHELFGHLDTGLVPRLAWCVHNLECMVLSCPYLKILGHVNTLAELDLLSKLLHEGAYSHAIVWVGGSL